MIVFFASVSSLHHPNHVLALLLPDKLDTYPQLIPTVRIGPLGVLVQAEF